MWDSGVINHPASATFGSFEWTPALPQNEKFQLRLRVTHSQIWSNWTEFGWFELIEADDLDNLIKNGGFEKAVDSTDYHWDHHDDASETGEIALVSTPVIKGARALKVEATGLAPWTRAMVSQSVAVEGGKTYLLSGDVYAAQLQNAFAELHIQYYNASNSSIGQDYVRQETATTGFAHLEKRSVVPEGAVCAQVSVRLSANGVGNSDGLLYADNIDLRETTDPNLLVNASFEHTLDTGAIGWQSFNAGTGTIGWTDTPVVSGSKAMKIEAADLPIWKSGYVRQRINVQAGQTFKLSGQLHAEELNDAYGQLLVWFYDENWTNVGSFMADLNQTTNGYVYLEKQGVIPEGTVLAEVAVRVTANQNGGSGTLYADALQFEYGEPLVEDENNLLRNGAFEYPIGSDIALWTKWIDASATGQLVVEESTGSRALKVEATGLAPWTRAMVSQSVAVEGGKTYLLSGDVYAAQLQNAFAELHIQYYNASNSSIGQDYVRQETATTGFAHLEKRSVAPEGAVRAQVSVRLSANGVGNSDGLLYADNIDLRETTDPNLLVNTSFEHTLDTNAIGWQNINAGTGTIGWTDTPVVSGNKAMKLEVADLPIWKSGYVRQRINVQAGETFKLSGQLHAEELNDAYGQLLVWFYDENWTNVGSFIADLKQTTNGYVYLEKQGVIPEGTVLAEVAVHLIADQSGGSGTLYTDALQFEYGEPLVEDENNLLRNGAFEYSIGSDIALWTKWIDASATGQLVVEESTGSRALKAEITGLAPWTRAMVSQSVAVEGGKTYLLSGDVYAAQLQNAFAELHIQYYNASNSSIGQDFVRQETATTGFAHLEKRSVAPEGAVRAQVSVRLSANGVGNGGGLLYADNIDLRETTDPNLLVNTSFEHTLDTNAIGWQNINAGTGTIGWTDTPVVSGNKAMKLEVADLPIWKSGYVRQRINVQAGETFKLSGQLHAEELNDAYGQLLVWFYDENWTNVGSFMADLNQTTNGYVYLEKQGVIPEGTALAEVAVRLTAKQNGGSGTLFADALKFEYGEPLVEDEDNLLSNGTFEHSTGSDIMLWTKAIDAPATGQLVVEESTGSRALKAEITGLAPWTRAMVSQSVAVEGGKTYLLSGDVYAAQLQNAFAELHIQYYNASNSSIGQDFVRQETATTGFAHLEKRSVAPEGVVRAQVSVRLSANGVGNGGGLLYADNIDLRETTDPNLLVNTSFEHTLDTNAIGWQNINAGTGTIGWTDTPVVSGNKAMKLEVADLPIWKSGYVRQRINVQAGETFKLSGQLFAEELNGAYGQLLVWFYDESWTNVGSFIADLKQTTNGYVYLEKQGVIPEGTVLAEVAVHLIADQSGGSGTLYADALKFKYSTAEAEEEIPVPESLQVMQLNGNEIKLSWTVSDPSQQIASYQVRSNHSVVASVYEPQWTMTAIEGIIYNFTVVAVNQNGQLSDESDSVVYTHDTIAPTAPTPLTVTRASETEVELAWAASEDLSGIKEYEVWLNGVLYQSINTTNLTISGLEAGIAYEARIRAIDNAGKDSWSELIIIPEQ
ncbi:carbohydrate binding domain-containing protein [Cohnella sp. LGH]|uniref:carbohydrate binding domain-containing protein n=1 Tax=Cohnella sp. LGH TaxID=1619153 RepID=UPI001ADBCC6C|nr:carbohydrate binding domain-containing protein [Cohnella sp. LGH]QTH40280.1 carbohydrate binding domain-containing protein [Cohnella sp. LGH]